MTDEDVRPAAFDREDPEGPTESDWITIGDRRYKVFKVPSRLHGLVPYFGYGGFISALVGTMFYALAVRRSSAWAARIYWQRMRWYNGRWHRLLQVEFDSIEEAAKLAVEFEHALRDGNVPAA